MRKLHCLNPPTAVTPSRNWAPKLRRSNALPLKACIQSNAPGWSSMCRSGGWTDHASYSLAEEQIEAQRSGYRRVDVRQHLPLRACGSRSCRFRKVTSHEVGTDKFRARIPILPERFLLTYSGEITHSVV